MQPVVAQVAILRMQHHVTVVKQIRNWNRKRIKMICADFQHVPGNVAYSLIAMKIFYEKY